MKTSTKTLRTAIYTRVSTEDQAREGFSLAAQQELLRTYAKGQGWTVAEVYVDDGYSGKNLDRPAVKRLIADAKAKRFDLVLVYRLDRLTRRIYDLWGLIEEVFEPAGVGFKSATEPFDTTTTAGKMLLGILGTLAQWERESIAERAKMGMHQAAKQGRWLGSNRITYGYRLGENRQLTPDHLTAPIVRRIFDLYVYEKHGYQSIAQRLNAEKIPTPLPNKKGWTVSTVRYMLQNPHYAGLGIWQVRGEREIFAGHHEALVPESVFHKAQAIMKERRGAQAPKRQSLLSGLVYCSECGGKMRFKRLAYRDKRYPTYVCYNYLGEPANLVTGPCDAGYRRSGDVEAKVLEWLGGYPLDPEVIDLAIAEAAVYADSEAVRVEDERAALLRAIEETGRRLARWYDAFESGSLDAAGLSGRVASLQAEESGLRDRLAAVNQTLSEFGDRWREVEELKISLREIAGLLPDMTEEEKWTALHAVIERVEVDREGNVRVIPRA